MRLPLVGQTYPSRSLAVSAQESLNVFAEVIDDVGTARSVLDPTQTGKNKAAMYGTPGRHLHKAETYPTRATWSGGGRLFIVSGRADGGLDLVEINSAGAEVIGSRHTLTAAGVDDGKPSLIFANGTQLLIISNGIAYIDNGAGPAACTIDDSAGTVSTVGTAVTWVSGDQFLTDGTWIGHTITINAVAYTIASVTDLTHLVLTATAGTQTGVSLAVTGLALTAVGGCYLDGYFIVQRPPGGSPDLGRQFNLSAILNGASWNGLDFASKEAWPDYIRCIMADNEQLYLFGHESTEIWQNDPGVSPGGFPLARINGATSKFGAITAWGHVSLDGQVFFLRGDENGQASAYVMKGWAPDRVSTHAEEAAWNAAGLGANAIAYGYLEEGHSIWVINMGAQTWAYDTTTKAWGTRAAWNGAAFTPYHTCYHTFVPEFGTGGSHITAGQLTGDIFKSSVNFYDDNGNDIAWRRALPYVYAGGLNQFFGRLELEMETGTVASGAAPVITYDYSDDRGKTFVNPRTVGLGTHGQTSVRPFWLRNGDSRGRVIRFMGIGQSKVALADCNCDITIGTA